VIVAHHLGEGLLPALAAAGAGAAPVLVAVVRARLSRIRRSLRLRR
jgi:hypothetical protein